LFGVRSRIRKLSKSVFRTLAFGSGATDAGRNERASVQGGKKLKLTHRELQVLRGIADGDTAKEIAAKLIISVRTVDFHTLNLFDKFGVNSRGKVARIARERGLLK
jgi:DNA-binding CsgD family transcriptional regulator